MSFGHVECYLFDDVCRGRKDPDSQLRAIAIGSNPTHLPACARRNAQDFSTVLTYQKDGLAGSLYLMLENQTPDKGSRLRICSCQMTA